jgi:hypothetical protein
VAYWGYFDVIKVFLRDIENPRVLEVGVDKGQMLLPLLNWLSINKDKFHLVGNDIITRDELLVQLELMKNSTTAEQSFDFYRMSSLEYLPNMTSELRDMGATNGYFHLMLIDGDHNYYTVKRELEQINDLLLQGGIVIFDDYDGRWSEKDEYFADFEEYKDNPDATKRIETESEKKGVKPAVDEFLRENKDWSAAKYKPLSDHEPIIIYRNQEYPNLLNGEFVGVKI